MKLSNCIRFSLLGNVLKILSIATKRASTAPLIEFIAAIIVFSFVPPLTFFIKSSIILCIFV